MTLNTTYSQSIQSASPANSFESPISLHDKAGSHLVRLACIACRSKHLKCSGTNPCKRCFELEQPCEYKKSRRGLKSNRLPKAGTSILNNASVNDGCLGQPPGRWLIESGYILPAKNHFRGSQADIDLFREDTNFLAVRVYRHGLSLTRHRIFPILAPQVYPSTASTWISRILVRGSLKILGFCLLLLRLRLH
jgi:hypothetical protein